MNSAVNTTAHLNSALRIAITGATGQVGSQLCRVFGDQAIPLSSKEMDLQNADEIRDVLAELRPQVVINAAAYTDVDGAESDAELCTAINQQAVKELAAETRRINAKLVQISTDYVFSNSRQNRPFTEVDPVNPIGVYATTKAAAEAETRTNPNHLIIRTCGVYGPPCPRGTRNFVSTILALGQKRTRLDVVSDQICNPTYVVQLADAIRFLVATDQRGTLHVVNSGGVSWFDLAVEILQVANIDCHVTPISTAEYAAPAPRPPYSVLDTTRYEALHAPVMSDCKQAVAEFLATCEATSYL